jgi:predicted dehydrogenase
VRSTRAYRDWTATVVPPDPRVAHTGFHHGASYLEHLAFIGCIRAGEPAPVTAYDGLMSVALGVAAHRSIDERRPVHIAELGLPSRPLPA